MTDPRSQSPDGPKKTRSIPPLVWIIMALLAGWLVVIMVQRGGSHETPSGGTTPVQAEGPSAMPAAPATGDAPATPAGTVNGPNQPAPSNP